MSSTPMIQISNLSKRFGKEGILVLDNIDLTVQAGEIFGVIGPSGAGKSTLIRCVNLLETPTTGHIVVDGEDLTQLDSESLREKRRKIGMIFQHFNLLSSRTTYENIALPLELMKLPSLKIKEKVDSLLELTGLTDKKNQYPSQLSGGQKQRVAIARALATDPKILLSDEATSSLDPQTTHTILQLLKDINQSLGVTILLITHEMPVVKEICHHLAILEAGKIVEQADVVEFFSKPKTHFAKQFIRQTLKENLPEVVQKRLTDEEDPERNYLLRFSFLGRAAEEPLIAYLIQHYAINLNILQANIEQIRDEMMGTVIVEASANEQKLQEGIQFLTSKGVNVEIIGYVKRND